MVIYVEGEDDGHIEPHLVFQMYCEFGETGVGVGRDEKKSFGETRTSRHKLPRLNFATQRL